jgi:hypothetical protein
VEGAALRIDSSKINIRGDRNWDERRGGFHGGRHSGQQWRQRDQENPQKFETNRAQQFDLRENLNQARVQDRNEKKHEENKAVEEAINDSGKVPVQNPQNMTEGNSGKEAAEGKSNIILCKRCGKVGHKSEECFRPLVCPRCKREGHVARACPEIMPWECITPFCGLAAPELGFHIIQDDDDGEAARETANLAVITIK